MEDIPICECATFWGTHHYECPVRREVESLRVELARREGQISGAMDKINLYERFAMRVIRDLEPHKNANPKLQSLWQRATNLSTDAARKGEGEV